MCAFYIRFFLNENLIKFKEYILYNNFQKEATFKNFQFLYPYIRIYFVFWHTMLDTIWNMHNPQIILWKIKLQGIEDAPKRRCTSFCTLLFEACLPAVIKHCTVYHFANDTNPLHVTNFFKKLNKFLNIKLTICQIVSKMQQNSIITV